MCWGNRLSRMVACEQQCAFAPRTTGKEQGYFIQSTVTSRLLNFMTCVARLTAPRYAPGLNGLGAFIMPIVAAVLLALLGLAVVRQAVPHERLARRCRRLCLCGDRRDLCTLRSSWPRS